MSSDRVLVTGSTGLIGRLLLESLRTRSVEAHGVTRGVAHDPLTHRVDLSVPEETAALLARVEPSVIIHLAGGQQGDPGRLYESNVLTTVNLLQAAARLESPPAFITTGSAAEYGDPANGIASESTVTNPVTEYGRAKLASSALARILSASSGIRLCIVRPFNVVSPHLPSATALGNMRTQLLGQTGRDRVVRCGRLDIIRDFVPVGFVVDVLSRVPELNEWPGVLNACSGVGIELGSVLSAAADFLDAEVRVIPVRELMMIPAAARIVGDPTLLQSLELRCEPTPGSLARILIGEQCVN